MRETKESKRERFGASFMDMIKKLRRKFILVATVGVVIIVAGALGLINTISYMRMEAQVETILSYISQNGGKVPLYTSPKETSWFGETDWSQNTPDFSYQLRYFSILVDDEGYARDINIANIAAFTKEEAIQYARTTVAKGQPQGFFEKNKASYGYMITPQPNGDYLIVIMDCTRDVAAVRTFMRYSLWFGVGCIILYVVILAALCNLAIKPFIRNMENQKRFITNAGHELKTPIAIISANTEALELISGKSQWTENILKQVQRLSKLINDLIMLSKMDEQKQELVIEDVNVSELAAAVAESFQMVAQEAGKTISTEIVPGVVVRSDSKRLYTLVNILMDNAVKYCDDGGAIAVSVTTAKKQKGALVAISNTYADGANMDYSHFFERFYRGDESHNSQKAGYGIGLSMAEELAQLLKGKLGVAYKDGAITFTIRLNS